MPMFAFDGHGFPVEPHWTGSLKKISPGKSAACLLLLAVLLFFLPSGAAAAVTSEDCLGCHETYKNVNHSGVSCTDCHSTITALPHEEKLPLPDCRTCHDVTAGRYAASVHKKKGLSCKDCHNVHYPQKDRRTCASCHAGVQHKGLPARADHIDRLSCLACHAKPESTGMQIRLSIEGAKGITPTAIDKNGNGVVDQAEWRALEETLRSSFKGRYRIERAYSASADPHTVTPSPAACESCHSAGGRLASAKLIVNGPQSFRLAINPRIFVPDCLHSRTIQKHRTGWPAYPAQTAIRVRGRHPLPAAGATMTPSALTTPRSTQKPGPPAAPIATTRTR